MPYTQKHTWFYGGGLKGWTENLYIRNVSPTIDAGLALAEQYAAARVALLGANLFIHSIRIQEVEDAAGNEVLRVGDNFQRVRYDGPSSPQAAHPDISALMDCLTAGNRKHKLLYLGGIWRTIVDNFGQYVPNGSWDDALINWSAKVIAFGYGWRARAPSAKFKITDVVANLDGTVRVTTEGTPFAGLGTDPFLTNIRGLETMGGQSPLNGERLYTRQADNIANSIDSIVFGEVGGVGFLNTFTFGFEQISSMAVEKIVSRERGAPLLQSPGRR